MKASSLRTRNVLRSLLVAVFISARQRPSAVPLLLNSDSMRLYANPVRASLCASAINDLHCLLLPTTHYPLFPPNFSLFLATYSAKLQIMNKCTYIVRARYLYVFFAPSRLCVGLSSFPTDDRKPIAQSQMSPQQQPLNDVSARTKNSVAKNERRDKTHATIFQSTAPTQH